MDRRIADQTAKKPGTGRKPSKGKRARRKEDDGDDRTAGELARVS